METTLTDASGAPCLTITLVHLEGTAWALRQRWSPDASGLPNRDVWRAAFETLCARATELGATTLHTRVETQRAGVDANLTAGRAATARDLLRPLGFQRERERAEFQLDLDDALDARLAAHAATDALRWASLAPDGPVSFERAAAMLARTSVGDPGADPDDDAVEFLRASLADPSLRGEASCVQIGTRSTSQGLVDVAFVMAQVNPTSGVSRITYMGVAPEHRGRGYGAAAHRHGLAMLRAQGGTRYHGGTSTENTPMLHLFRALGATALCAMEEWTLRRRASA
jgi:ribosomal protein S18 acetylase RimI-like enzyme